MYVREYQLLKEVDFVSNWTSYIALRGCWCDIIVLDVHALSDDSNDSIYEELEQIFYHSRKYYMKSLLGDFKTKQGSEYTGRFIMFSVITNIYNKKTKGPTLM